MTTCECPLCGLPETRLLESICSAEINTLYDRAFGISEAVEASELEYRDCIRCGLRFFWPLETGTFELYEKLQIFDWYYMADKYEYSIAQSALPDYGSVLEVGAGKAAFAQTVGLERYTGLELNDKAIEQASYAGIKLLKQTIEEHADSGNHYDAVISFQVLEHVADPAGFICGCVKCLKPGGLLILAVPASDGFAGGAVNHILDLPPHHVTRWSSVALQHIAQLYGLGLLKLEYEPVAIYHHSFACKTIWEQRLRRLIGLKPSLVDISFSARIVSRLASYIWRFFSPDEKTLKGHTVVAIYEKKLQ